MGNRPSAIEVYGADQLGISPDDAPEMSKSEAEKLIDMIVEQNGMDYIDIINYAVHCLPRKDGRLDPESTADILEILMNAV